MKIVVLCQRIRMWQPWPYIAYGKDGPLSWWFYERLGKCETFYVKNGLGNLWDDLWSYTVRKLHRR